MIGTRNSDRIYLLTGFLITPDNRAWAGHWDSKMNGGLYRVGKRKKISARRIDAVVIDRVIADLQSEELAHLILKSVKKQMENPIDGRQIAGAEKKLDTLTRKVDKLVDLITDNEGTLAADAYKRTLSQAEAERSILCEELSTLRTKAKQHVVMKNFGMEDVRRLSCLSATELKAGINANDAKK